MKQIDKLTEPPSDKINFILKLQICGMLEKANVEINTLIEYFPKSWKLYNLSGAINFGLSIFDKSILSFIKSFKINPNSEQSYINLGGTLLNLDEINTAILYFKKALKINSKNSKAFNNLGLALQKKGEFNKAKSCFLKAIKIQPNYTDCYFNLGILFNHTNNFRKSIEYYKKAIFYKPNYVEAYYNMGLVFQKHNKNKEAIYCFEKACEINPKFLEAKHHLDALTGNNPSNPPNSYVAKLFDFYAPTFEKSLIGELEYKTPELIKKMLLKNNYKSIGSVLDLGCGTGLLGDKLKKYCSLIDGIDLSKSMLEEAKKKNIYRQLFHLDIINFLKNQKLEYDNYISADVFVYLGDLSQIFELINSRCQRKASFLFTTENDENNDFKLQKSGRYSHSTKYIESLSSTFNFDIIDFEISKIRKDKGKDIMGGIYLLKKN